MNGFTQIITNKIVTWTIKGEEGDFVLMYKYDSETYSKKVKITYEKEYESISKRKKTFIDSIYSASDEFMSKSDSALEIKIKNKPLKVMPFKIIKWDGWLISYILLSIIFSTVMRKVMKVS